MEMAPPAEATSNSSAVAETKEETSAMTATVEEQTNSNLFEGQQQRVDGELGQRTTNSFGNLGNLWPPKDAFCE